MPIKKYDIKNIKVKKYVEDAEKQLMILAAKFRNPSQKQALYSCCTLLRSAPRDVQPDSLVEYYSPTITSRKESKWHCLMSIATTILNHYYWLPYNRNNVEYDHRYRRLKAACRYLDMLARHDFTKLEPRGNIRKGYLLTRV